VLAIGYLVYRRRVGRRQLAALALSYLGVLLAFGHDLRLGGRDVVIGGALVFASALSYAIYLVGSGELVGRIGALRLTAYASIVACMLCLAQFALIDGVGALAEVTPAVWSLSLLNGTVCTVFPVAAVMLAIARIGPGLAAQIGMLGPVSTIVLSVWVLGEAMGPWQVAGTVLVLAGVLAASRRGAAGEE